MGIARRHNFLDLFPAPQFLTLATAGIAITDDDINIAELKRSLFGGKLKLNHLKRVSGADITPVLRDLASSFDVRFANATLPDEKVYLFTVSVDKAAGSALYDSVAFILEQNVPITLAESVFSYEIVSEDKNKVKLAVTVAPKSFIDIQTRIFESAGITIVSFDTESQAIARAVIPRGDKRPHLIINLSPGKTGFYIVENEVVQFSTTLNRSADANVLQQGLNVSGLRQASEVKAKMTEVLSFWANRVEKVLLCGLWSHKNEFIKELKGQSSLEFAQANIWSNTSFLRNPGASLPNADSLDCAAAIGSALEY